MRWIFFISFLIPAAIFAQPSDFIILKKKNKTIQSFYAGTQIQFVTTSGAYRNAVINRIENHTLYLQEYVVNNIPTQLGFFITDTAGSYRFAYHYNQVKMIGKKPKTGFNLQGSGAALFSGGVLLTLASGVVFIADREKFSPGLLIASAGLGVIGYFLSKSGSKGIVIGKNHYRIEYMKVTSQKG